MINRMVSVIVPVYNCESTIERCLNSILNQTYTNIEIIVINDGSKDSTMNILNKYKDRIRIFDKENTGPSDTRNIGLDNSNGDFICFIDADDYLDLNAVKLLLANMTEGIDVVRFKYCVVKKNRIQQCNLNEKAAILSGEAVISLHMMKSCFWNTCWGQLIKRSTLTNVRFNPELRIGEDLLFNYYLYKNARKIKVIDDVLYFYVENSLSITRALNTCSIEKNIKDVFSNYYYLYTVFDEGQNKQLIINRTIQSIISYERQLLYVSFFNGMRFISTFNNRNDFMEFISQYDSKEYRTEAYMIRYHVNFLYCLYILVTYVPLKALKEWIVCFKHRRKMK